MESLRQIGGIHVVVAYDDEDIAESCFCAMDGADDLVSQSRITLLHRYHQQETDKFRRRIDGLYWKASISEDFHYLGKTPHTATNDVRLINWCTHARDRP